jgi:hypothetical protein
MIAYIAVKHVKLVAYAIAKIIHANAYVAFVKLLVNVVNAVIVVIVVM